MNNCHHNHDEEEEFPEEEEVPEEEPEEEETTIVRTAQQDIERAAHHPKIDAILQNPDVLEVHVRYQRGGPKRVRQPYICIVFKDGSTIERPLADISNNEQPLCTTPVTSTVPECPTEARPKVPTAIEPKRSRWNFMRLKNRGQQDMSDISTIIADNDNVVIKRTTTIIRKGCGCSRDDTSRGGGRQDRYTRRRRVRDSYNNVYTIQE